MEWLTALLAFATTMLVFAIIVSTLVEMIHRIFGMRRQGLRLMLENLYSRVILPHVAPTSGQKLTPTEFADVIMENRASLANGTRADGLISRILRRFADWAAVSDISVEVFTQKLANAKILERADVLAEDVVKDIAQKYEAFGDEMSTFFESRARLFSVCVALVIAWTFYIHPYNLAVTYIRNPQVAQAMAEKAGDVQARYAALMEKLDHAASAPSTAGGDTTELKEAIGMLQTEIVSARQEARKLREIGAPLGPNRSTLKSCDEGALVLDCTFEFWDTTWTLPSVVNAFWLMLGGLLIGLGAPFWAQAVATLTASRDLTKRITDIVSPREDQKPGVVADRVAIAPPREGTAVASYNVSRAALQKAVNPAPL